MVIPFTAWDKPEWAQSREWGVAQFRNLVSPVQTNWETCNCMSASVCSHRNQQVNF